MDAHQAFAGLMERDDSEIRLGHAALLFAKVEYPGLDVEAYLDRLEQMAEELRTRLSRAQAPPLVVETIDRYLFAEQGFAGNQQEYYDPRNSYLNDVLDRRLGIPITLSAVYLEVAGRAGFHLEGVNMPGHFLLRHPDPSEPLLIDAFNGGTIVTEEECRSRLRGLYGDALPLTREILRPIGVRSILFRMLSNLKAIYAQREDWARAVRTVGLMLLVDARATREYRDRGLLRYRAADFSRARADLERYLELADDPPDAGAVREHLAQIDRLYEMRN